jgi:hypothetical protein
MGLITLRYVGFTLRTLGHVRLITFQMKCQRRLREGVDRVVYASTEFFILGGF